MKETFRRFAQGFLEDFWALHFRWAKRLWPAERRILAIAELGCERGILVVLYGGRLMSISGHVSPVRE